MSYSAKTFIAVITVIIQTIAVESMTTDRLKVRANMEEFAEKMTDEEKSLESKAVRSKLYDLPKYMRAKRVGIYLNRPEQVKTDAIIRTMVDEEKIVFIPKATKRENIEMVKLNDTFDLTELRVNQYGFRAPDKHDKRPDALFTGGLNLLIIPGIAFSSDGKRLGGNRGFYDRFVRRCRSLAKNVTVVGLAYRHQMVPIIPDWDFPDIKVDIVLSP